MDYRLEQLRFELQEDPTSRVFFKLGEHLRRVGELDEAVDVLRQGLDTHPHYVSAWVSLGRSLHDLGDTRGAWRAFARALELDPENGVAARCAGEAAIANGEWVEAVKSLKRARGMMPQDDALDERIAFVEERLEELGLLEAPKAAPPPPPVPPPKEDSGDDEVVEVDDQAASAAEPDDVFDSGAHASDPVPAPVPDAVADEESGEPELEFVDEPSGVIVEQSPPAPDPVPVPVPVPVPAPDESSDEVELEFVDEPSGVLVDDPSGVITDQPSPDPDAAPESVPDPAPVPDVLAEPVHEPAVVDVPDAPPPPPPDLMYQPESVPGPEPPPPAAAARTQGPLPTMTLARLAVEQGDLELAESTARGVLERDPGSHEARQMLEWLASKAAADEGSDRTVDGDARPQALRRWLDAVRLAAEKLES